MAAAFNRLISHEIVKETPRAEKRGLFGMRRES